MPTLQLRDRFMADFLAVFPPSLGGFSRSFSAILWRIFWQFFRRPFGYRLLAALLALSICQPIPTLAAGTRFSAHCLSVVDGDTINVDHGSGKERVIFYGIDCPELGQDFGDQARKFTDDCCYKKDVTLEDHGKDPKGRTIAVVFLPDGTNLNQELVKRGLAWWSDKYAPNDVRLKQLHQAAKQARLGLWAQNDPIPPWIWRNGSKNVQATIKVDK